MNLYDTTDELLAGVEQAGRISDAAVVTIIEGDRQQDSGSPIPLRIEIRDAGERAGAHRWAVVATDKDTGNYATGNPAARLDVALELVHWAELDG